MINCASWLWLLGQNTASHPEHSCKKGGFWPAGLQKECVFCTTTINTFCYAYQWHLGHQSADTRLGEMNPSTVPSSTCIQNTGPLWEEQRFNHNAYVVSITAGLLQYISSVSYKFQRNSARLTCTWPSLQLLFWTLQQVLWVLGHNSSGSDLDRAETQVIPAHAA